MYHLGGGPQFDSQLRELLTNSIWKAYSSFFLKLRSYQIFWRFKCREFDSNPATVKAEKGLKFCDKIFPIQPDSSTKAFMHKTGTIIKTIYLITFAP